MDNELIIFQRFDNPVEANIVKAKLIDAGIECFLRDEHFIGMNPIYSNAAGGIKLIIDQKDLDVANGLLTKSLDNYKEEIKCKFCHSKNVHFVTTKRRFVNWLSIALSMITFLYPLYLKKVYHCDDCHKEFDIN